MDINSKQKAHKKESKNPERDQDSLEPWCFPVRGHCAWGKV